MKVFILCSLLLVCSVRSCQANRAKDLIRLIADVVKTSPSDNKFIEMIDTNSLSGFIVMMIEDFGPTWSGEFITTKGTCLAKDPTTIPLGKRSMSADDDFEKREEISVGNLLNILNSPEGQEIIKTGASGGDLTVPPPKYASSGVRIGSLPVAGRPSGGLRGKRETKAFALLSRVRSIVVNPTARGMFLTALDDYTTRISLYNVCNCDSFADFIQWYANMMS